MNETPLRILIVDDYADSARMLRALLKGDGHQVRIEFDGPAALAAAEEFQPNLILLDLTLPGMSGIEVAEQIRRRPELDHCQIAAVTGHGAEVLPSPSPFHRHFQKPLDQDALKAYLKGLRSGHDAPFRAKCVA